MKYLHEDQINVFFFDPKELYEALNSGDPNVWEKVAARVASFEVDVMIHLGGQVHSTQAFKDAMIIFQRHEQTGFVTTGQLLHHFLN